VIAAGHATVVDAVFADPHERAALVAVARTCKVPLHGVFLTADLATRMARVTSRERDASDADVAVVRRQESYDLTSLGWTRIDASGTPEATLRAVKATLP